MAKHQLCLYLGLFLLGTFTLPASEKVNKWDAKFLKKKLVQTFILPRPSSIFNILESEEFDFDSFDGFNKEWNYKEDQKIAMNLGSRVVDGMLLLYCSEGAKQKSRLKNTITAVINLTRALGLEEDLADELDDFKKSAGNPKALKELKKDIDRVAEKASNVLRSNDDPDLAVLVSLGGWLETLYISTSELADNYNDLLSRQVVPRLEIANSFIDYMEYTPEMRKHPLLSKIFKSLKGEILPRFEKLVDEATPEKECEKLISELKSASKRLKTLIEKKG